MSLLATSSPWDLGLGGGTPPGSGSGSNGETKKRTPTIRRTIKKPVYREREYTYDVDDSSSPKEDFSPSPNSGVYNPDLYSPQNPHQTPPPPNDALDPRQRMSRILEKMTGSTIVENNDGQGLANFQPMAYPELTKFSSSSHEQEAVQPLTPLLPQGQNQGQGQNNYSLPKPVSGNHNTQYAPIRDNSLSDYQKSYDAQTNMTWKPHGHSQTQGSLGSLGSGGGSDKIWDRLGYIIHLLEQQVNEKTDHILEEYVLYVLLGVFVIFVVDSFSRYGRYVRT